MATFGRDQFGPDRGSIDEHTESGDGGDHRDRQRFRCQLNTLAYSVPPLGAGAPGKGTVSIDRNTGAFTYQPSTGARLAAQSTSGPDFDTFTVNVDDGQVSTPVTVTVAVLPATPTLSLADTAVALGSGSNPSAVAVYGNRTYVANAAARDGESAQHRHQPGGRHHPGADIAGCRRGQPQREVGMGRQLGQ